jgi:hypothetical protein
MALMTCGGADVLSAHITLPLRGPWTAEVVLDTPSDVTGSVTLAAMGGLSLAGTVAWGQVNTALQQWEGVLVGGAGGLSRTVSGAYQFAQLRDPLGAIMQQSGETQGDVAADVLAVSLPQFSLGSWTASAGLEQLAAAATSALASPVNWRVLSDGRVWIGVESWPAQALPAGAEIIDPAGADRRVTIGPQTPALLPGVNLDGVGRVIAVDHWIDAFSVRTWAWTEGGYDSAQQFRRMVRAALSMDLDGPLVVDRLALYRAEVKARASDGSTVDLQPAVTTIPPIQNVPVRVGVPGMVAIVSPGAVCRLGWDGGDPSQPRAMPVWDPSATVEELVLNAVTLYLGGKSGAKAIGLDGDAVNAAAGMVTWMGQVAGYINAIVPGTVSPAAPANFGTLSASATIAKGK